MTPTEARSLATVHALHQSGQLLGQNFPVGESLVGWAVVHGAGVLLSLLRPRLGMAFIAALGLGQWALTWPRTGNHLFLGVFVSLLIALLDTTNQEEGEQLRKSLLALPLIAFGWSGLQKLAHGLWFQGETLAWSAVSRSDIASMMKPMLGEDELRHLASLSRTTEGSGPFRLSGLWRFISNAIWVLEIAALALWHPKVRRHAHWALLAGVWAIQLVAHEWEFALLLTNVLLAQAGVRAALAGRSAVLAGVVLLALARLGLVPVAEAFVPSIEASP